MYKPYNGINRELVICIHKYVVEHRIVKKDGQRTLAKLVKKKFKVDISENTISGWIHRKIVPYTNEKTQFKTKPIPPKKELSKLYLNEKLSASRLAQKYRVSTIIVINWLKKYGITPRNHTASMNTPNIKKELAELKLTKPTKNFSKLGPEKAYIIGVLCGDGYIDKNFLKLEIRKDKEFIEEFTRCIESIYGIKYNYYYYEKRNSYILNVTSRIICKDLLSYDNFRTKIWKVPDQIRHTRDDGIKSHFLRGLYDSDGSVAKYNISFTTGSKYAIEGISKLLTDLGIKHSIYKDRKYLSIYITNRLNRIKFKNLIGFTILRKLNRIR